MIGGSTFAMSLAVTSYSRDRRARIRIVRHSSVRLPSPPTIAKPRKLAWCLCHVPGLVTSPSLAIQKPEQWKFAKRLCSRSGRRPGQQRRNTALTRNRRIRNSTFWHQQCCLSHCARSSSCHELSLAPADTAMFNLSGSDSPQLAAGYFISPHGPMTPAVRNRADFLLQSR